MDISRTTVNQTSDPILPVGKKRPKKWLKLILAILFVAALSVGGYFGWKKVQQKKNAQQQATQEAPTDLIGQYKQQLPDLKKKADSSSNAEDLQNYGIAQYATGDVAGAEQTYAKQIEKDPSSVVAHSGLANALRDQKKYDQAVAEYEKVIELNPSDISAYVNLASVYQYQLNQKDKAIETYQKGIEKNPKSADLLALEGLAYEQNNDTDSAKQAYEKALEVDPNNLTAKVALDRINK